MTDGRGRWRRQGLGVAGLAVVGLVVAAGCTGSASSDQDPGTASPEVSLPEVSASPSPSGSSPVEVAEREAVAAYLGMWRDFVVAARTSDWESPRLDDHATGDALLTMSRGLYANHYNGLVTKGQPRNDPTVSSVKPGSDPKTVLVSDCGDDSQWLEYEVDTGKRADDEPGGRREITAEVKKQDDGSWKVTRFAVEGVGTC